MVVGSRNRGVCVGGSLEGQFRAEEGGSFRTLVAPKEFPETRHVADFLGGYKEEVYVGHHMAVSDGDTYALSDKHFFWALETLKSPNKEYLRFLSEVIVLAQTRKDLLTRAAFALGGSLRNGGYDITLFRESMTVLREINFLDDCGEVNG